MQVTDWPTIPPVRIERGQRVPLDEPFDDWVIRMLGLDDRDHLTVPATRLA